ncbi:hypothetical protein [Sinorhizobium meliloti]|uniref:hypothetical protein n=1 Tax=Rhizobium meliloti TaxID=382 RepID=UPI000FD52A01|nr:hypothetical protein [Sinorhizobium meliloti]RVR13202.1 hypothetical protein CN243_01070 [Sinorhizobium meliloti]
MPVVPLYFDPPVDPENDPRLIYSAASGGRRVTWPDIGVNFFLPERKYWAYLSDIVEENNGFVVAHGQRGYSIGHYHEFFLKRWNGAGAAYKMGDIEATIGTATPLAVSLFVGHHREKYFGGWGDIWTLRLIGVRQEDLEAAVLNALLTHAHAHGELLQMLELDDSIYEESHDQEDDSVEEEAIMQASPIVTDLEPLRFYYAGLAQEDAVAACIYFYRVIEFYSFMTHEAMIRRLRHDGSLTDHEFSRKILDVVTRDEKGPVFRLIAAVADNDLLERAKTEGVVQNALANVLAESVYAFRNSIVHGKFSYGFTLESTSLLEPDQSAYAWKGTLRELAKRTIERMGSRRL